MNKFTVMILEAKGPSSYQNKNKTLWRKTISVQDRHCWNKLRSNIKEINSVSLFKKKLEQRTCMASNLPNIPITLYGPVC